jgi:polysaccharide export outer membrane protein
MRVAACNRLGLTALAALLLVTAVTSSRAGAQDGSAIFDLAKRTARMQAMPGDRVQVQVFGEPTLSGVATLDEQGRVTLPRIGTLTASQMAIADLRDTVRARLAAVLRDPIIDVSVLRRIVVSGEVIKPGVYFADLTSSVAEMIAQSGGLKETAKGNHVDLIRGLDRHRIEHWESDLSPAADLRSGDQINVGRQSWLELNIIPFAGTSMAAVSLLISLRQFIK